MTSETDRLPHYAIKGELVGLRQLHLTSHEKTQKDFKTNVRVKEKQTFH